MASIQPIEGSSVHKIQSGQVIVDLSSVVKELVENSLDAGATSIDVRFKNHGLESIEVQDNGSGIPREDYESIALKHYTSKLRSYEDLSNLDTFGFRGEAISSLCALANVYILTAREDEAPKGSKLVFETSGRLRSTQVVAAQRGTTVAVETVFKNLPVRRQELEKNIKREYGKVLNLLQAYACISTDVKFAASNAVGKKKVVVFSTKSNKTTRDNIANVYGAKTLSALVPLDLSFEMQPSGGLDSQEAKRVQVLGHVSRPVVGEGRLTPDRQMFFVNSRPCVLPQVAKVVNEVYKTYNLSQSPFVFANVLLDTNAYDVNVSPDKRTILLHDQGQLLDSIKETLIELFDNSQQSVPQSQKLNKKLPSYKPLTVSRQPLPPNKSSSLADEGAGEAESEAESEQEEDAFEEGVYKPGRQKDAEPSSTPKGLIHDFLGRKVQDRAQEKVAGDNDGSLSADKQRLVKKLAGQRDQNRPDEHDDIHELNATNAMLRGTEQHVEDFNRRLLSHQRRRREASSHSPSPSPEAEIPSISTTPAKPSPGVVPNAFERMRPMRTPTQTATITIGSKTTTSTIGSQALRMTRHAESPLRQKIWPAPKPSPTQFSSSLRSFAAAGSQLSGAGSEYEVDEIEQSDDEEVADGSRRENASSDAEVDDEEENPDVEATDDDEDKDANPDANPEQPVNSGEDEASESSDGEWLDEGARKAKADVKVANLIRDAEARAARPSEDGKRRVQHLLKGGHKDATTRISQTVSTSIEAISHQFHLLSTTNRPDKPPSISNPPPATLPNSTTDPEALLSLTVSKSDFARMRIIGQFNLGFIIALRPSSTTSPSLGPLSDDLFIIDQHASDEKSTFEHLSLTTNITPQPLAAPLTLTLTAIEEELVLDNAPALLRNGFAISTDTSGDSPVGQRCTLTALPTSREVTFSTRDLEELLVLLSEDEGGRGTVRPSKVRRMLAMRACRGSVMVGKVLGRGGMERLVRRMGGVDKPWNCPHGRPTMRHLVGLGAWEGWREGMGRCRDGGEVGDEEDGDEEDGGDGDGDGDGDGHGDGDGESGERIGGEVEGVDWERWVAGSEAKMADDGDWSEGGDEGGDEGEGGDEEEDPGDGAAVEARDAGQSEEE